MTAADTKNDSNLKEAIEKVEASILETAAKTTDNKMKDKTFLEYLQNSLEKWILD